LPIFPQHLKVPNKHPDRNTFSVLSVLALGTLFVLYY